MHPRLHQHMYTYFLPIVQNPGGVDLPVPLTVVSPSVSYPAASIAVAPQEKVRVAVYLGKAFALLMEEIVMQVWAEVRGGAEFYVGNDGHSPWSRFLTCQVFAEGYEAPLELAQPVPVSMISPDSLRRGGNLQFSHMLPPRGQVTLYFQNVLPLGAETLNVGGHIVGEAYRSDTP